MKRLKMGLIFLSLFILLTATRALTTEANEPTAVTLRYFRAESVSNGVKLIWETASELDSSGFTIERSTSENGTYQYLPNIGFVAAVGYEVGALYQEVDTSAILGQTYWYRLVDYDSSNVQTTHPPVRITSGVNATATPIQLQTATPRPTNTSLPTVVPTNTPAPNQPTNTPAPNQPTKTPNANTPTTQPGTTSVPATAQPNATATVLSSVTTNTPTSNIATPATNNSNATVPATNNNSTDATTTGTTAVDAASAPTTAPDLSNNSLAQISPTPMPDGYPATNNDTTLNPPPSATELPDGYNNLSAPTTKNPVNPNQQLPSQDKDKDDNTGTLWAVFIISLLIFAAGVYGSIKLFKRQG